MSNNDVVEMEELDELDLKAKYAEVEDAEESDVDDSVMDSLEEDLEDDGEFVEEEVSKEADEFVDDSKQFDLSAFGKVPDAFRLYLNDISKYTVLSPDEEHNLAVAWRVDGDKSAREKLLNHNYKLVVSIAKRYTSKMSIEDGVQEGNLGLMRAVDLYDPFKGYKFSTYATWWIRQFISRAIFNDGSIRIPVHAREVLFKYNRFVSEYVGKYGKEPSMEEAKKWCIENKKSWQALKDALAVDVTVSMNMRVSPDDNGTEELQDFIPSKTADIQFKECYNSEMRKDIEKAMSIALTNREIYILRERFGWDTGVARTLESVGSEMNITRERIRQIEKKALRKLRNYYKVSRGLKEYAENLDSEDY